MPPPIPPPPIMPPPRPPPIIIPPPPPRPPPAPPPPPGRELRAGEEKVTCTGADASGASAGSDGHKSRPVAPSAYRLCAATAASTLQKLM